MPHGKSLLVTGVVVLVLMSAGMLALKSLAMSLSHAGDRTSSSPDAKRVNTNDPFAGTPAAKFPVGVEGIALPTPVQVGPWTPAQVQDVLQRTKQTLVAARLDKRTVQQGDAAQYLSTISEGARATVEASLKTGDALAYVSRLAPNHTLLAPIRVQGTMTVKLGAKQELVVSADYVWVYPLSAAGAPPSTGDAGAKLVVVHTDETYQWFAPKGISRKDTGLRPGAGQLSTFNMDCDLAKSGKLGLARTAPGAVSTVPDDKAYDVSTRPEELPNTCGS